MHRMSTKIGTIEKMAFITCILSFTGSGPRELQTALFSGFREWFRWYVTRATLPQQTQSHSTSTYWVKTAVLSTCELVALTSLGLQYQYLFLRLVGCPREVLHIAPLFPSNFDHAKHYLPNSGERELLVVPVGCESLMWSTSMDMSPYPMPMDVRSDDIHIIDVTTTSTHRW